MAFTSSNIKIQPTNRHYQQQETTMTFTSSLYHIATNPQHADYQMKAYHTEYPIWFLKDNVLYKRQNIWARSTKNWFSSVGLELCEDNAVYHPVIKVENGVVTTWETQIANIGNKILDMTESARATYYPNLYFVQIGNHPYAKEGRLHKSWLLEDAQRESHRIIYPHHEPKQFFMLPKDIPL